MENGQYYPWSFAFKQQNYLSIAGKNSQRSEFNVQQQHGQHTGGCEKAAELRRYPI